MKNQNRYRETGHIGIFDDYRFRIVLLALFMLLMMGVLIFRLYFLQLHHGEAHRNQIEKQSIRRIRIPGWRGSIYSADGVLLAGNRSAYDLVFYPEGMRVGGLAKTAKAMVAAAEKLALAIGRMDYPGKTEIARHLNITPGMPLTVLKDLSVQERAGILENSRDMKGLDLQLSPRRIYPQKKMAAHLIGYARNAEADRASDREEFFYYRPDSVGKAGVELAFDELPENSGKSAGLGLRAFPGRQVVQVSNVGFVHKELLGRVEPVHGNDVYLTIDSRAQSIAESLLAGSVGSMIVMDADTGDIICAASSPSYDLSLFTPRLSPEYYQTLLKDPGRPLINRSFGGIYPPGSTLKPLICLALLAGKIDPAETVFCSGSIEVKGTVIRCQAHRYTEADVDMELALEKSCNTYMIVQALKAGFPVISAMLKSAGIGEKSGVEIHENQGQFPDPALKKKRHGIVWNDSDTALLSIGQGFISMTPLQLVRYTAALCNGGKLYQPHLVYQVCDSSGEALFTRKVRCVKELNATPEMLEQVRSGMFRVVNAPRGSGRMARSERFTIFGKTGTAEIGPRHDRRNITHFIAYVTVNDRRYALAVTVEDGISGGRTCAPLALRFFERYLNVGEDHLQPVEEERL